MNLVDSASRQDDASLMVSRTDNPAWPALPLSAWSDTQATLHMWMQIVGKIRLVQSPGVNHCWNATFYVTPRGLTTSPIPYAERTFEMTFDFVGHELSILTSDGRTGRVPLQPQSVIEFYEHLMDELGRLDIHVKIHKKPNEVLEAIPFDHDDVHKSYDAEYAHKYHSDRIGPLTSNRLSGSGTVPGG